MRAEWRQPASAWAAWHGWSRSPIFRRERRYWDRRLRGQWWLDDLLTLSALINLCLLPAALLLYPPLLISYGLLDEALSWLTAFLAALGIMRERQNRTWRVLRVTPLTSFEILAGKLAACTSLTAAGARRVTRARWLGTLAALPLFGLMVLADQRPAFSPGLPGWAGAALAVGGYGLFLYRPQINAMSGACVGLACSTLEHTGGASLAYTSLAGAVCLAGSAAVILALHQTPAAGWVFGPSVLAGRLTLIFAWLFPWAAATLGRALLIPAGLALAATRLPRLDE